MMMSRKFCRVMLPLPLMERLPQLTAADDYLWSLVCMPDDCATPGLPLSYAMRHLGRAAIREVRLERRNLPSAACLPRP